MKARSAPLLSAALALLLLVCHGALARDSTGRSPLPAPSGPHGVGRTQFTWVDAARGREVVAWVWYPASTQESSRSADWLPGKWQAAAADLVGPGSSGNIPGIRTHASDEAVFAGAKGPLPLLVFAPGMGMVPLQYAALLEELASHGYVVAGVVPTGYAVSVLHDVVVEPHDKIVPTPLAMGLSREQVAAQIRRDGERLAKAGTDWTGDIMLALREMTKLNADRTARFHQGIDLQRIGVFGHSQGGSSSLQVAQREARVRAVVVIDGMLPADFPASATLAKPAMVLLSDTLRALPPLMEARTPNLIKSHEASEATPPPPSMGAGRIDYSNVLRTAAPGYLLRLKGTSHLFSADFGALRLQLRTEPPRSREATTSQITSPAASGSLDAARALVITSAYVRAFFDQSLRERRSALLEAQSTDYPEVEFQKLDEG